jgi:UDP-N-acetyl-D-glucosamine dehydrogenase
MINICVIGQGYVGLPISIQAASAGFNVFGLDIDSNKIENLKLGITSSLEVKKDNLLSLQKAGKLTFVTELTAKHSIQIYIIAVPTPLNKKQEPELSMLQNACETIAKFVVPNSLVINESTSFIGTLRNFIKPLIEKNSGTRDLKYAVAPERIDPGNEKWNVNNTPRIISGLSENAINEAIEFYSTFCGVIHRVDKPEIAEAAKLMENTFRQVNIALVNELTEIASKFNFSLHDAISAAATKPFGFMPFYPGIGVGGHCIPVDPTYLSYSAKQVGAESSFINLANTTNTSMPHKIVSRIESYLKTDLNGKLIQLAGIAYKTEVSDIRESPALELIILLESKGSVVTYHDPFVDNWKNLSSVPLNPKVDLGIIITPHKKIDYSVWKLNKTPVIDLSSTPKSFGWPKFL